MKKLIDKRQMGLPYDSLLNKAIVRLASMILGINQLNDLYSRIGDKKGLDFAQGVLDELGVVIECDEPRRLRNIPGEGPFIVVANHPYGALDGLILIVLIASVRPDVKFLGDFLISQIDELSQFFLPVSGFKKSAGKDISGVRTAFRHLSQGHPLIVFPAGEVSSFQKGFRKFEDREWSAAMGKFIQRAGVEVIPVYIGGRNSLKYQVAGKVHPLMQTLRLPRELLNKRGQSVSVVFGSPVPESRVKALEGGNKMRDYLRANVYCLRAMLPESEYNEQQEGSSREQEIDGNLSDPLFSNPQIEQEMRALQACGLMKTVGDLSLFIADDFQIPHIIRGMEQLPEADGKEGSREQLFSGGSEGIYRYLLVWDSQIDGVVAAFRLGYGDKILTSRGFDGFYSYRKFEFKKGLNEVLRQSIELYQTYMRPDYPKATQASLLLWSGILNVWLTAPHYRFLIGAIELSADYSVSAKRLLVDYIRANHWNGELAAFVLPRNGVSMLGSPVADPKLIRGIQTDQEIDKLIRDTDVSGKGMPVVLKKYLQYGGQVMGFNLDRSKHDALGVLLVLDMQCVPLKIVRKMEQEMGELSVLEIFREGGHPLLAESE